MKIKPEPCKNSIILSQTLHNAALMFGMESVEFARILDRARRHYQTCQQCKEYTDWVWENCVSPHPELELEKESQADSGKPAWGNGG